MFKKLISTLIEYIETKVEIYKIQVREEAVKAFTAIILVIVFLMIALLFILFLSLFIAEIINQLLSNRYYGYLIVSGIYIIIGVIVYVSRKKIYNAISDLVYPPENDNKIKDEQ